MRHSVREAIQTSSARIRQVKKEEIALARAKKDSSSVPNPHRKAAQPSDSEDEEDDSPTSRRGAREKPKEFEKISTSAPKRLNDIVQAPPEIKKLPRKAKKLAAEGGQKGEGTKSLREGVMSMAQKAMMDEARERAIRLYREMKKGKGS